MTAAIASTTELGIAPNELGSRRRMRWLIAAHLVLAAAPVLQFMFLGRELLIVGMLGLAMLPFGSAMTLSVWTGLGRAAIGWRLLTSGIATAYLGMWYAVGNAILGSFWPGTTSFFDIYPTALVPFALAFCLFGSMFLILGRFYEIVPSNSIPVVQASTSVRFSMLHVLVLMSVVAVILSLMRVVREAKPTETASAASWTAEDTLGSVVFLLNAGCAAYAALWPSNVKRNVALVLIVTVLLGVVMAFATRSDESVWWQFVASMLIGIIPTVVQLVSLLVVRSCGYRLIRRDTMSVATTVL